MAGKLNLYQQDLQRFAQAAGEDLIPFLKDKVLKQMTPEERLRGLTSEDVVRVLTPEERLRGLTLEERLLGLDPEIQEKIKQLIHPDGTKN